MDKILLPPKKDDSTVPVSARVPRRTAEALRQLAERTGYSKSDLIEVALKHFIERVVVPEDAGDGVNAG